jgi:hypothetical protein
VSSQYGREGGEEIGRPALEVQLAEVRVARVLPLRRGLRPARGVREPVGRESVMLPFANGSSSRQLFCLRRGHVGAGSAGAGAPVPRPRGRRRSGPRRSEAWPTRAAAARGSPRLRSTAGRCRAPRRRAQRHAGATVRRRERQRWRTRRARGPCRGSARTRARLRAPRRAPRSPRRSAPRSRAARRRRPPCPPCTWRARGRRPASTCSVPVRRAARTW